MTPSAKNGSTEPAADAPADDAASYEHARDELALVVARLESGGLSLDESLTLWERGEHLRERVETALRRSQDSPEA